MGKESTATPEFYPISYKLRVDQFLLSSINNSITTDSCDDIYKYVVDNIYYSNFMVEICDYIHSSEVC